MTHGEIWLVDFGFPVGSLPAKTRPVVVMQNDLIGIKDSVAVIHLIGAVNKFSFVNKISKLAEENYEKLVNSVNRLISNKN